MVESGELPEKANPPDACPPLLGKCANVLSQAIVLAAVVGALVSFDDARRVLSRRISASLPPPDRLSAHPVSVMDDAGFCLAFDEDRLSLRAEACAPGGRAQLWLVAANAWSPVNASHLCITAPEREGEPWGLHPCLQRAHQHAASQSLRSEAPGSLARLRAGDLCMRHRLAAHGGSVDAYLCDRPELSDEPGRVWRMLDLVEESFVIRAVGGRGAGDCFTMVQPRFWFQTRETPALFDCFRGLSMLFVPASHPGSSNVTWGTVRDVGRNVSRCLTAAGTTVDDISFEECRQGDPRQAFFTTPDSVAGRSMTVLGFVQDGTAFCLTSSALYVMIEFHPCLPTAHEQARTQRWEALPARAPFNTVVHSSGIVLEFVSDGMWWGHPALGTFNASSQLTGVLHGFVYVGGHGSDPGRIKHVAQSLCIQLLEPDLLAFDYCDESQPLQQVALVPPLPADLPLQQWWGDLVIGVGHGARCLAAVANHSAPLQRQLRAVVCSSVDAQTRTWQLPVPRTSMHLVHSTGLVMGGSRKSADPGREGNAGTELTLQHARRGEVGQEFWSLADGSLRPSTALQLCVTAASGTSTALPASDEPTSDPSYMVALSECQGAALGPSEDRQGWRIPVADTLQEGRVTPANDSQWCLDAAPQVDQPVRLRRCADARVFSQYWAASTLKSNTSLTAYCSRDSNEVLMSERHTRDFVFLLQIQLAVAGVGFVLGLLSLSVDCAATLRPLSTAQSLINTLFLLMLALSANSALQKMSDALCASVAKELFRGAEGQSLDLEAVGVVESRLEVVIGVLVLAAALQAAQVAFKLVELRNITSTQSAKRRPHVQRLELRNASRSPESAQAHPPGDSQRGWSDAPVETSFHPAEPATDYLPHERPRHQQAHQFSSPRHFALSPAHPHELRTRQWPQQSVHPQSLSSPHHGWWVDHPGVVEEKPSWHGDTTWGEDKDWSEPYADVYIHRPTSSAESGHRERNLSVEVEVDEEVEEEEARAT